MSSQKFGTPLFLIFCFLLSIQTLADQKLTLMIPELPHIECMEFVHHFEDSEGIKRTYESLIQNQKFFNASNNLDLSDEQQEHFLNIYLRRDEYFKNNHPAYSKSSKAITYSFESPELSLSILQGPFKSHQNQIHKLSLRYNPEKAGRFSYLRFIFGSEPLELDLNSIPYVSESYYTNANRIEGNELGGDILKIRLHKQASSSPSITTGPLIIIARATGQLSFHPSEHRDFFPDLFYMTVNQIFQPNPLPIGKWRAYTWEE